MSIRQRFPQIIIIIFVLFLLLASCFFWPFRRTVVPGETTKNDNTADIIVFEDLDGNGSQNNDEQPIPNTLVVAVANVHGNFLQYAALTDKNGRVTITADYTHYFDIRAIPPCGYITTTPSSQSAANAQLSTKYYFGFQPDDPQAGAESLTFDAWNDSNRDGRLQTNELPLNNVNLSFSPHSDDKPFAASDYYHNDLSAMTDENGQAVINVGNSCGIMRATPIRGWDTTAFEPDGNWEKDSEIKFDYDAQTTAFTWGASTYKRFKFASGTAHHPEGMGEWRIDLDTNGEVAIEHRLFDTVTEYDSFTLTEAENQLLWAHIAATDIPSLPVTFERPGIPDETAHIFTLYTQNKILTVQMWADDAAENPDLLALTDQLFLLIETYTDAE